MKFSTITIFATTLFFSITAMAAGNHAGGHDDASIGRAGSLDNINRTVNVKMTDAMRFTPSSVTVKQGETIKFVVKNAGKIKHEMVLGNTKALQEHAALMKKMPAMEHADDNMVTVQPGETREMIWQFTQAGKVHFACLQPGHYDAGMKGLVKVGKAKGIVAGPIIKTAGAVKMAQADAGHPPQSNKSDNPPQVSTPAPVQSIAQSSNMTEGEIRKIDKDNLKVTIKHGEIKNLDMPGMTMVFQVKDAAMLDKIQAGDKVKFQAEKSGSAFVVTEMQVAK